MIHYYWISRIISEGEYFNINSVDHVGCTNNTVLRSIDKFSTLVIL